MNTLSGVTPGIALLCDLQGQIIECLHDGLGLPPEIGPGASLTQLVDRESLKKTLSFLVELRTRGAVFGWELNVPLRDGVTTLHFAGIVSEETLLVVGAETDYGLQTLYEELMRINNEQLNALRASVKARVDASRPPEKVEQSIYEEISRLNNELVAMQRKMAKKNAQLEKLNEQKNEFLGMAAHDLRNPLHVISAFSEFLLEDASPVLEDDLVEMLEIIHSSSEFMTRLVTDLLDVAKIESGKLDLRIVPTDLVALTRRTVDLNRLIAAKKKILLHVSADDVPLVPLDPDKITQVLNNLLSNAIKYSEPQSNVSVRLAREDGQVLLSVQDEGQGIPAEELDRIFQPFERTSVRSTGGEKSTGLGLVIVKHIVQGHGGELWLESEVGKGTTAYVSLPLAPNLE